MQPAKSSSVSGIPRVDRRAGLAHMPAPAPCWPRGHEAGEVRQVANVEGATSYLVVEEMRHPIRSEPASRRGDVGEGFQKSRHHHGSTCLSRPNMIGAVTTRSPSWASVYSPRRSALDLTQHCSRESSPAPARRKSSRAGVSSSPFAERISSVARSNRCRKESHC